MERYLNIILPKVRNSSYFSNYLHLLHGYIMAVKSISPRYENFFLQGSTEKEARMYKVPDDFSQFMKFLSKTERYPNIEDTFFILGLWNGMELQTEGRSFQFNFSTEDSNNLYFTKLASAKFHFPLFHDKFDDEITREIHQLVPLAFDTLPCSFITEYDFNYISQYDGIPDLIVGSTLYVRKIDMNGIEGIQHDINDELVALSCINDKFDSGNPEHVKKAHAWEKTLLNTPEFLQLLLR